MTRADGAAVLVPVPVEEVVAAVLDGPVTAVIGQDGRGIGAVRGVVGEAVDGFGRTLAGGFLDDVAFDDEGLADARKVEVVVETGGGPDRALFDAPMRQGERLAEVGLCATCLLYTSRCV